MRLDQYLLDQNISPTAFAELIGVGRMQVWRYTKAGVVPRPNILQRIYAVTEGAVCPNDFLGLHGSLHCGDGASQQEATHAA